MSKRFHFKGHIHPKEGGDDKEFETIIEGPSQEEVEVYLRKWLAKRSDVVTDYILVN